MFTLGIYHPLLLNVGNILDDWDRLRIIYLFFLLFGLYFSPYFLSGSDWGTFFMNSVQQNGNYAVLSL